MGLTGCQGGMARLPMTSLVALRSNNAENTLLLLWGLP